MGAGGVGEVKLGSMVSADLFKIDMRTEIRKQMLKMLTGAPTVTVFVNTSIAWVRVKNKFRSLDFHFPHITWCVFIISE
jgi:hypothetical protein